SPCWIPDRPATPVPLTSTTMRPPCSCGLTRDTTSGLTAWRRRPSLRHTRSAGAGPGRCAGWSTSSRRCAAPWRRTTSGSLSPAADAHRQLVAGGSAEQGPFQVETATHPLVGQLHHDVARLHPRPRGRTARFHPFDDQFALPVGRFVPGVAFRIRRTLGTLQLE